MLFYKDLQPKNIIAIDIYLERRKTREYVGRLDKKNKKYRFVYADSYLHLERALRLSVEFPLTKKVFYSKELFPTLQDRIPDKENPAYVDYCAVQGIDIEEQRPLVLLATIGKRGPSCFVFEPVYKESVTDEELLQYRQLLGLTIREFAQVFSISIASIRNLEQGLSSGTEVLKRLRIYKAFPEVALYQFLRCGNGLHLKTRQRLLKQLQEMMDSKE